MRDVPPLNADVRWSCALGLKRVMAHAFRIELVTETLASGSACLTAERGGATTPRSHRRARLLPEGFKPAPTEWSR